MPEEKLLPWESVPREEMNPLLARQVITGKNAMVAKVFLKKGCIVPAHSHESEQLTYIMEGALHFTLGDKPENMREVTVRTGEVLVIPSWLVHKAVALEDTLDMDIFSPIREDWLNGTDQYLRK